MQNRKLQLLQRSMPRPGHVAVLLVGYLCAVLSCPPSAYAASNSVIWERGDQIVKLVGQDDDSAKPNDHPTSITPDEIKAMLETLRLRYADEGPGSVQMPVFTQTDIDSLSKAFTIGLGRATPSQDLIFHVIGARRLSSGALARRNRVCAGRVFYRDGNLNIIFGQVQTPYRKKNVYGQIGEDFYPRNYGKREAAANHDVVLLPNAIASLYQGSGDARADWIVIKSNVAVAGDLPADKPDPVLAPTGASSAAPAVLAEVPKVPSTSAIKSKEIATGQLERTSAEAAPSTAGVEARLKALKQLRERELISEDAYQAKMKEILQDL